MKFDRQKPYNDLPSLPPARDVESKEVLKQCIAATRSLAELKGLGNTIPNQSILIDSIVIQEAKSSSEIENIVTTNDKLYKAASKNDDNIDSQTKEVLLYRSALKRGFESIRKRPLNTNTLLNVAKILNATEEVVRSLPGTQLKNPVTNEVFYTPPMGKDLIMNLLSNLEQFLHENNEIDPLVKMAIAHYQFEAIHPFYDGNGRTGRIMNILYLVETGLLDIPVLYLSYYIINHKPQYYNLLREVTENGNWQSWLLFILKGVDEMARSTTHRIREIQNLFDKTLSIAREKLPVKVYSKELIEVIFTLPYIRIANLVDAGIAKRQTASEYLKGLSKAGFLVESKEGKENLYLNKKLLALLQKSWDVN